MTEPAPNGSSNGPASGGPRSAPAPSGNDVGRRVMWLVGAAAMLTLAIGGVAALKMRQGRAPASEVARTEPVPDPSPLEAAVSSPPELPAPEAQVVAGDSAPAAPVRRRRPPAAAPEPVPEQVIGVTPASAVADVAGNDEIVVTAARHPVWASTPSRRRLSALYPERALERGREGEASVHCTVLDSGALDCEAVSEFPAHAGFGAAALRVARTFRHAPQRADGSAAAGTPVNLRVVFRMDDTGRRRG